MIRSRTQCSRRELSALRLEIHLHVHPDLGHLAPGDFERLVLFRAPTLPPACEPPGPAGVHPFGRGAPSQSGGRRLGHYPRRELDYHTVHFSHLLALAISHLLVQESLSQLHLSFLP